MNKLRKVRADIEDEVFYKGSTEYIMSIIAAQVVAASMDSELRKEWEALNCKFIQEELDRQNSIK